MSVRVVPYRNGGFEVDIRLRLPDGSRYRERVKAPVAAKSAALRWAQDREAYILRHGRPGLDHKEVKAHEVPTVSAFASRFIADYARAERQKESGIRSKQNILDTHILPLLGTKKLDAITTQDVQALKAKLADRKPKTVNNVLTVLGKMLRVAVEWGVIDEVPCRLKMHKNAVPEMSFYGFDEYEKLLGAAQKTDARAYVAALLGGSAGLRCGEILALEWSDVDFTRGWLVVKRAVWRGHVGLPKGGRSRRVPMTARLAVALRTHKHLIGPRVLYADGGIELTEKVLRTWMEFAQKRAGLPAGRAVHVLRHTFCSHLAMKGATVKAIQELAGHAHLTTTMRYMHLSPNEQANAIRLLDQPASAGGDMGETALMGT